jgi:hypothetical protein
MFLLHLPRFRKLILASIALLLVACPLCRSQAALLMEQPYGLFGQLNPTGHNAVYLARLCAETPVELRPCRAGEYGAVIARYEGIDGYDWIAIPLIPYLYSVNEISEVPERVDRATVERLRDNYRETGLTSLGNNVSDGNFAHGGWTELVGSAYERRIYAFWFQTTPAQDDALMEKLNAAPNQTKFSLLFSNCADYARVILNNYFPGKFRRSIFPDAGMTTPKQIASKLVRYGRKHPEAHLRVIEIPQVPGYRRSSHSNKDVAESLVTTVYAIPLVLLNPWLTGGIAVDYVVRGRYHIIPKHPQVLGPDKLSQLSLSPPSSTEPASAETAAPVAPVRASAEASPAPSSASSDTGDSP